MIALGFVSAGFSDVAGTRSGTKPRFRQVCLGLLTVVFLNVAAQADGKSNISCVFQIALILVMLDVGDPKFQALSLSIPLCSPRGVLHGVLLRRLKLRLFVYIGFGGSTRSSRGTVV